MDFFHYADNRMRALSYGLLEDAEDYEDSPDFPQPTLIPRSPGRVVPVEIFQQFASTHPNATLEILQSGHELLNVLDHMAERVVPFFAG